MYSLLNTTGCLLANRSLAYFQTSTLVWDSLLSGNGTTALLLIPRTELSSFTFLILALRRKDFGADLEALSPQ